MQDKEYILEQAKAYDVKFIRLWFTDILGYLKGFAITVGELEHALEEGMGFDGSSIEGFARIDESDMVAMPDPSTFTLLPWRPKEGGSVARMFCDIVTPEGKPCATDPRYILKRQLAKAAELGYTFYVGPELEYFYFKSSEGAPQVLDHGGYFDLIPHDEAVDLRRETVLTLEEMGIAVEYSHHEVAPSQHEIDLRYCDGLTMADNAMTYRLVVKEIALKNDCYATFMPKPLFGQNGSGMHVHQSLFKGDRNAFFNADAKSYLSDTAHGYIAGLMAHAPEITLVTNQWVNSFKRLVPGYEAPVYVSWGQKNRSDMVRVPIYKPGRENATRVEFRSPDPSCNPYLAFAAMLAAGLKGITENYPCPEPIEENVYHMGDARRKELGIGNLPRDLAHATDLAENSTLLKECLGEELHSKLIENKRIEWENYSIQVSQYELEKYLPVL